MAVYITPQSEIDKYFDSENLSQSVLKTLSGGLDKFLENKKEEKELYYQEKGNLIIGSAVDCILTGEEGRFDDEYFVSDLEKKPSDVEMSMINMVFDNVTNNYPDQEILNLGNYMEFILESINYHQWYKGNPGEKRIAGLIEGCSEYFENLKMCFGKQVIDRNQRILIDNIVESLKNNERTKAFFDREIYDKVIDIDIYYQLPVYFEYKGIACKALLDMVFIFKNVFDDDIESEIISVVPVDLKTMNGSTTNFISSLKTWRYDIQAAWYTEALSNESSTFKNIIGDQNPVIDNFKFVVESTSNPGKPLVYQLGLEVLYIGKYGRPAVNTVDLNILFEDNPYYQPIPIVKEIRGFDSLIDEYLYYQENGWEEDRVISYENDGVLQLGWEGIVNNHANRDR